MLPKCNLFLSSPASTALHTQIWKRICLKPSHDQKIKRVKQVENVDLKTFSLSSPRHVAVYTNFAPALDSASDSSAELSLV